MFFAVIGPPEYALIILAIVLLFGAKKIPELGRSIGEGIREFRKSSRQLLEDEDDQSGKSSEDAKEKTGSDGNAK
jgi:sec-independent protein translocase protein TatA